MPRTAKAVVKAPPNLPASTFILDNGACSIKAGFAPTEQQSDTDTLASCQVIPNAIARTRDRHTYVGAQLDDRITQWSEVVFRRPVEHGQLVSWEAQKEIWDRSFFNGPSAAPGMLVKDPGNTTLILTETPNTLPAFQRNADEIIMEEWGFGGYIRAVGPSLNSYNDLHPLFGDSDTTNGLPVRPLECLLVIDSGFSHTMITPIYRGRPLERAVRRLDFGGKHLTNLLKEVISVRYFDLHQDTKIVNDIKEDVCFVSRDFKEDMEKTWKGNKGRLRAQRNSESKRESSEMEIDTPSVEPSGYVDYILPDGIHRVRGFARPHDPYAAANVRKRKLNALASESDDTSMTLGNERFTVPEIIFTPSDISSPQPGLADAIMQSLSVLPPLIQATMLANTLVVGGNANLPGFVERLQSELMMRARTEWVVRVRKMNDPVKSTWLGGAKLAGNRDTVREYGVTREEYLEHGSQWCGRKFVGLGT